MSDIETRFHETWLGMVQPIEGLVVSVPVLVDAQCMARQSPAAQRTLRELTLAVERKDASGARTRKKADEDEGSIAEELGDILFTVATLANSLGIDLDDVARRNLDKVHRRDTSRWVKRTTT